MKAILISDHPKWCALMMNGIKKIEVRKGTALYKATQKLIDEYGFAEFYVYCTKDEWLLYKNKTENKWDVLKLIRGHKLSSSFNGKVLFKFRCYKVEEISYNYRSDFTSVYTDTLDTEDLEKQACLTRNEFAKYLKGNYGYAWHISNLEIFDKPRDLSEFYKVSCKGCLFENTQTCHNDINGKYCRITKAPQSWQFVESEK